MLNNTVVSYIRTGVPMLVGLLVGWLQPFGIDVDSESATALLVTIASGLYYAIARMLEKKYPQLGWLLGVAVAPSYNTNRIGEPPVPAGEQVVLPEGPEDPPEDPEDNDCDCYVIEDPVEDRYKY